MKEVLKEIAFQQTGCTDTVCEIKIGEMLAADKIVSGNIIKKEKKYIITITTRNVKDKSLEFSETMDLYNLNKIENEYPWSGIVDAYENLILNKR